MASAGSGSAGIVVGRYSLYDEIAAGGMASVHIGRLLGPAGFSRTVAIKRLHAAYAKDPAFVAMFLDEARLASRIRHPNVVATLDVAATDGELFLVMDYVQGDSLSALVRAGAAQSETVPLGVCSAVVIGLSYGLHAAHEATDERGEPLGVVHRDVSPHNVLVGVDGVARVVDFGIAKAAARVQTTAEGQVKGKIAYMSPEQLRQGRVDRRADVFAASIVLWELLTGRRLFAGDDLPAVALKVLSDDVVPPSRLAPAVPSAVDGVVLRGLARDPDERFATAQEMAVALERALPPASPAVVGEWVRRCAGDALEGRAARIREIEGAAAAGAAAPATGAALAQVEAMRRRAATLTAPVEVRGADVERTDASLVASAPKPSRARGRIALQLVTALSILGLGAAVLAMRARSFAPAHAGAAPSVAAQHSAQPAPEPSPEPQPEPAPPAPDLVAPSAPLALSTAARPTPRDPPRRRARPSGSDPCDPPYVWDSARQIRVYKKECR